MSDLASFLISLAAVLLWGLVISPLLCGLFGTPLPLNFRERRIAIRRWSFTRYLWLEGVLTYGLAMFLGMGLNEYFRWRQWNYPWPRPSVAGQMLLLAVEWLAFGAIWAWFTWDEDKHQRALR